MELFVQKEGILKVLWDSEKERNLNVERCRS